VACGTGLHAAVLQKYYKVDGLDLDAKMLAVASQNFPQIPFHQADMADFDLGKQFDAITCLFSSIGMSNQTRLGKRSKRWPLASGGVLIVEPWFTPNNGNRGWERCL
jgi:SAM-dependent methyltransferase